MFPAKEKWKGAAKAMIRETNISSAY